MQPAPQAQLPLLHARDPSRVVVWREGAPVRADVFLAHVRQVRASLPPGVYVVNLCEDRYSFLVAFCAIVLAGQTNLLPPSRAPRAVAEIMAAHPGCHALAESRPCEPPPNFIAMPALHAVVEDVFAVPNVDAGHLAVIGYTSGSTGQPQANRKTWGSLHASNAGNMACFAAHIGTAFEVVATVPPQHMYGLEMSVLLPLLGEVGVHAGRPFFAADIARELAEVPAPRVLVITPVHLRALLAEDVTLPPLAAMVSATAPMPLELAQAAEDRFGAPLVEVFGSTETCVFASRRTTTESLWALYPDVHLHPQPDGTRIEAPQLAAQVTLADLVELPDARHFRLCGRNTDLLEIAGKRASLGDLNRRLLSIPGVEDGVMFQLDRSDAMQVRRIAALVVAPTLSEAELNARLREMLDPAFLPRPLRRVAALPRNETGKLPRQALLAALRDAT
ncbi:AMP-binding protein [Oleiagrimonas soli]|nr:AMP-binding protein [Oleiagrimonas soli]KGI76829.1 AMP-ligase [Oleiagrimonas soli]